MRKLLGPLEASPSRPRGFWKERGLRSQFPTRDSCLSGRRPGRVTRSLPSNDESKGAMATQTPNKTWCRNLSRWRLGAVAGWDGSCFGGWGCRSLSQGVTSVATAVSVAAVPQLGYASCGATSRCPVPRLGMADRNGTVSRCDAV